MLVTRTILWSVVLLQLISLLQPTDAQSDSRSDTQSDSNSDTQSDSKNGDQSDSKSKFNSYS